jgi:hypothetical protein
MSLERHYSIDVEARRNRPQSNVETVDRVNTKLSSTEIRNSWVSELKIFHGGVCDNSFFKVLARP